MKKRLFYLDFIRTVAVLSVLICHFTRQMEFAGIQFTFKILPDYVFNVYLGSFGVGLFFIISGASLMHVYSEKISLKNFYSKRFWAIYPMFWIAYLLAFVFQFYQRGQFDLEHPKWRFLLSFLGMDGYLSPWLETFYLVGEWFLGCLILLYLIFPLLRVGVKKYPVVTAVLFGVIFVLGSYRSFHTAFRMSPECWFFMRIPELLVGMYYVEYKKKVHWYVVLPSLLLLVVMQSMDVIYDIPVQILKTVPVCVAAFFVLVYISDFLECKFMSGICQLVGKYSYAIFLCHHFILMKLAGHFCGRTFTRFEVICMFVLALVLIAIVSKILFGINKNIVKWVKDLWKGEAHETKKN